MLIFCAVGNGSQVSYVSYFPLPHKWDKKNGFAWLEWTNASETLFQLILRKNRTGSPPKKAAEWRAHLRGFGSTRRLLEINHARSSSFLHDVCPIRRRR